MDFSRIYMFKIGVLKRGHFCWVHSPVHLASVDGNLGLCILGLGPLVIASPFPAFSEILHLSGTESQ